MSPQELGKEIRGWIERFVSRYPQGAERIWRTPLVGFADANSPYLQRLPELVMPGHRLPQDYLEQAMVVISYFVPFTKAHGDQNLKGENDLASPSWAQSYLETNRMIEALNLALAEEIRRLGYHAVVPYGIGMDETLFRRADADGFDRQKCYQMTCRNLEAYGADCCGKCDVGLPCSYRDPTK